MLRLAIASRSRLSAIDRPLRTRSAPATGDMLSVRLSGGLRCTSSAPSAAVVVTSSGVLADALLSPGSSSAEKSPMDAMGGGGGGGGSMEAREENGESAEVGRLSRVREPGRLDHESRNSKSWNEAWGTCEVSRLKGEDSIWPTGGVIILSDPWLARGAELAVGGALS